MWEEGRYLIKSLAKCSEICPKVGSMVGRKKWQHAPAARVAMLSSACLFSATKGLSSEDPFVRTDQLATAQAECRVSRPFEPITAK